MGVFLRVWRRILGKTCLRGRKKLHDRLNLRLFATLSANSVYILYNATLSFFYGDFLLFAVAVYYFLLAVVRYRLLRAEKKHGTGRGEYRITLFVALLLILLDLSMGVVIFFSVAFGQKRNYRAWTLVPQVLFLLYCITGAVFRIANHKKRHGAVAVSVDLISLAAALFSAFNLINYLAHVSEAVSWAAVISFGLAATLAVLFAALFMLSVAVKKEKHL